MFLSNPEFHALIQAVEQIRTRPQQGLMVLVGEKAKLDVSLLLSTCNQLDIPVFGGIFPQVIHGRHSCDDGVVIKVFDLYFPPVAITNLSKEDFFDLSELDFTGSFTETATALTMVDGLSSGVPVFLEQINNRFGNRMRFLGAGAGFISLVPQACVFTNRGFFQDAAVIAVVREPVRLGVRHGWEKMAGPFVATKTKGNIIQELNWINAFTVYRGAVDADSPEPISTQNFLDIAQGYPLGLLREFYEDVVRDPIAVGPNGELQCIGDVPSNSVLYILKGRKDSLLDAADQAGVDCSAFVDRESRDNAVLDALVIDCVTRTMFLKEDFPTELQKVHQRLQDCLGENVPEGMLSLGEIASVGRGVLEIYNKTIVVGLFSSSPVLHHA